MARRSALATPPSPAPRSRAGEEVFELRPHPRPLSRFAGEGGFVMQAVLTACMYRDRARILRTAAATCGRALSRACSTPHPAWMPAVAADRLGHAPSGAQPRWYYNPPLSDRGAPSQPLGPEFHR